MEKPDITPDSRCGQYYLFASEIQNVTIRDEIEKNYPGKPLNEIYFEDFQKEQHFGTFTAIYSFELLVCSFLLCWVFWNSYVYGYKEKKFCQSFVMAGFYLFSALALISIMISWVQGIIFIFKQV
jgi:hypothetical protein